jgi:hypothetical protein
MSAKNGHFALGKGLNCFIKSTPLSMSMMGYWGYKVLKMLEKLFMAMTLGCWTQNYLKLLVILRLSKN